MQMIFVALALFLSAQDASERPATLVVTLPADAVLEVSGVKTRSTGELRTFVSPPLPAGEEFVYTLRATWKQDGKDRTVERKVQVTAGAKVEVDLNPDGLSADERELLALVNQERAAAGVPTLRAHPKLMRAARAHSANMARQGQLNHTLDGKGPGERIAELGYASSGWGENVAAGQRTPAEAMASWMGSPGHRGNILNPSFTEVGLGVARDTNGGAYWTQVFGTPRER